MVLDRLLRRGASRVQPGRTVGLLDKGGLGKTPPSAAIRVHRRARNSEASGLQFTRLAAEEYAAGGTPRRDTVLVVRDAVPPTSVDALLQRVRSERTRLVVDLDDDLVTDDASVRLVGQGYEADRLDALKQVISTADQVLASTGYVADLVRPMTPADVTVVANQLDPLLWSGPAGSPDLPPEDDDELRLLYMGSKTHDADLALLDGLPHRLASRLGRPVVLEVVGITRSDLPSGARRLVPTKAHYPGFVAWLRRNQARWAVGLAPLVDERFNHAKSDLKLLEYAALDLVPVASQVGPYSEADPDLALHADGAEGWAEQVGRVLRGEADDLRARAAEVVRHERTMTPASLAAWHGLLTGAAR